MDTQTTDMLSQKQESINDSDTTDRNSNEPYSHHFFDSSKSARRARAMYFKIVGRSSILVLTTIFLVFSIYWGALWRTEFNVHHIKGWVVDFDGGLIGQTVANALGNISGDTQIAWQVIPSSSFPGGPSELAAAVLDESCWVAVSINPGATSTLNAAISSVNASYNASHAVTAFAAEARNENSYRSFILPMVNGYLQTTSSSFATAFAQSLASNANLSTILSNRPQLIVQPLSFTVDNLRPFNVPVASAVTFVGLIYLTILSFMVTIIGYNARLETGLHTRLTLGSLIALRMATPVIMYFILSCFYSLLSYAFELPFNRVFGHSGFIIFWMLSWFGMLALGLALEAMITLLTHKFVAFFLVLWIISNVSVSFLPLEYLPGIYRYGHAAPFYNVSLGVRAIVFGTKNYLGLNFGILFAWIAVSCITIPLFQWLRRRSEVNAWLKQQQGSTSG